MIIFEMFIQFILDLFIKPDREPERRESAKPDMPPNSTEVLHETWSCQVINNDTNEVEIEEVRNSKAAAELVMSSHKAISDLAMMRHRLGLLCKGAQPCGIQPQYSYIIRGTILEVNDWGQNTEIREETYTVLGTLRLRGDVHEMVAEIGGEDRLQSGESVSLVRYTRKRV